MTAAERTSLRSAAVFCGALGLCSTIYVILILSRGSCSRSQRRPVSGLSGVLRGGARFLRRQAGAGLRYRRLHPVPQCACDRSVPTTASLPSVLLSAHLASDVAALWLARCRERLQRLHEPDRRSGHCAGGASGFGV